MALGEWKDRIIIQKSAAGNDKAGNHVLAWRVMIRQETTFYRGWIITPATPM